MEGAAGRRDPEPPALRGARCTAASSVDDARGVVRRARLGRLVGERRVRLPPLPLDVARGAGGDLGQRDARARRSAGRGVRGRGGRRARAARRAPATGARATPAASGSSARTPRGRRTTTCCARPTTPRGSGSPRSVRRRTTRWAGRAWRAGASAPQPCVRRASGSRAADRRRDRFVSLRLAQRPWWVGRGHVTAEEPGSERQGPRAVRGPARPGREQGEGGADRQLRPPRRPPRRAASPAPTRTGTRTTSRSARPRSASRVARR